MSSTLESLDIERPKRQVEVEGCVYPVFTNVIDLPERDCGLSQSIIRLANVHIGHSKIKRRTPLRIINTDNQQWTIRYAMGNNGSVKGLNKSTIAVDYDATQELGVSFKQPVRIIVKKASLFECLTWLATSPDLNVRLNTRLGLLGASLGLVGLAISLISLL
ncbi:hypothetical protein ACPFUC_001890 [Vibrio cholerae]|nr:hypothetical protein KKIDH5335_48990 [Vibrio fluvialis]